MHFVNIVKIGTFFIIILKVEENKLTFLVYNAILRRKEKKDLWGKEP